jgi:2-amino-4-hydroxy-6-hydroxymethyldihydropteridine diphosphokinase
MARSLIALGSNLGDRDATIRQALETLAAHRDIAVLRISSFLETKPIGGPSGQPSFLNAAAILDSSLAPPELLAILHQTEQQLGRTRAQHWGARTIDLDLLLYEQETWHSTELVIPHPRLAWREFVLRPAAEIAGDWIHPEIGWNVARLLHHLRTAPNYVAISGPPGGAAARLARELLTNPGGRWVQDPFPHDHVARIDSDTTRPADTNSAAVGEHPVWDILDQQLAARALALDQTHLTPPAAADPHWLISDFWLAETLGLPQQARPSPLPRSLVQSLHTALQHHWPRVCHPKLLVLLQPSSSLAGTVGTRMSPIERESFAQVPCLVGYVDQFEAVRTETRAALEAMTARQGDN